MINLNIVCQVEAGYKPGERVRVTWVKVFSILTDFSFLAKVQTVFEIRVNLTSFLGG